jgi:hypothetical protein
MASTYPIMDASRRVCQFAYRRTQRRANAKRNWLLNLGFLGPCDLVRLKDKQRRPPKTNNDNRQKLTTEPTDSESPALYRGDPSLKGCSVVGRSSSGTARTSANSALLVRWRGVEGATALVSEKPRMRRAPWGKFAASLPRSYRRECLGDMRDYPSKLTRDRKRKNRIPTD